MRDTPLQYTHSGARFLLGYGEGFFGIWDRLRGDAGPAERFPRDDTGWAAAWIRFAELEPDHVLVGLGAPAPDLRSGAASHEDGGDIQTRSGRVSGAWWIFPLVFGWVGGAIAWFALRKRNARLAGWLLLVGVVNSVLGILLIEWLLTTTSLRLPGG